MPAPTGTSSAACRAYRYPAQRRGRGRCPGWRLPSPADRWKRLSSPLQRARRTAELLQPSAPVTVDSALREMSFGTWEGQHHRRAARERRRGLHRRRERGSTSSRPAGSRHARRWPASVAGRRHRRGRPAGRRGVAQGHDPRAAGAGHGLGHDGPAAAQARLALPAFLLGPADGRVSVDRLNVPL